MMATDNVMRILGEVRTHVGTHNRKNNLKIKRERKLTMIGDNDTSRTMEQKATMKDRTTSLAMIVSTRITPESATGTATATLIGRKKSEGISKMVTFVGGIKALTEMATPTTTCTSLRDRHDSRRPREHRDDGRRDSIPSFNSAYANHPPKTDHEEHTRKYKAAYNFNRDAQEEERRPTKTDIDGRQNDRNQGRDSSSTSISDDSKMKSRVEESTRRRSDNSSRDELTSNIHSPTKTHHERIKSNVVGGIIRPNIRKPIQAAITGEPKSKLKSSFPRLPLYNQPRRGKSVLRK